MVLSQTTVYIAELCADTGNRPTQITPNRSYYSLYQYFADWPSQSIAASSAITSHNDHEGRACAWWAKKRRGQLS